VVGGVVILLLVGIGVGVVHVLRSPVPTTTTTTTSTTTTLAPTTTTTLAPSVTMSAVGDTDLGNTPQLPANPAGLFAPVRSLLTGDIVFGNLEGTMTTGGPSKCAHSGVGCYAFRVPPSYARVYRDAGFTVLNSANNHSYDFGAVGESQTSAALGAAGIVQAGLPGQIGLVTVHGVRVAFCDFAPYGLTNNLLSYSGEDSLIATARREASVVVVYMHAGAEGPNADHVTRHEEYFYGEDRGNPYLFAHRAIDDGASVVIGSGPHVVRGMEWYRGHLIAYSLGDFTNYEAFATVGNLDLSFVLHLTLTRSGHVSAASVSPVVLLPGGQAVPDPRGSVLGLLNSLSRSDFASSAALVSPTGRVEAP
jgi:hypothetical protein